MIPVTNSVSRVIHTQRSFGEAIQRTSDRGSNPSPGARGGFGGLGDLGVLGGFAAFGALPFFAGPEASGSGSGSGRLSGGGSKLYGGRDQSSLKGNAVALGLLRLGV